MGLFRRDRKNDADEVVDPGSDAAGLEADGGDQAEQLDDADQNDPAGHNDLADQVDGSDEVEERFNRVRGPFDAGEVDDEIERIDLGSLRVPPVEGMQLRLELDQEQQSVVSANAMLGDSGVQLQVFAAPRTLGVWPDIRAEIADSVLAQGGSADVVDGPLGRELLAGIPTRGADGRTVRAVVRFLGVDGPRWFLRAVMSGPAAQDSAQAAPLVDLVRNVVVVRDDEARPPREALPLRLPSVPDAQPADNAAADGSDSAETPTRSAEDLRPFERGPEITEVR